MLLQYFPISVMGLILLSFTGNGPVAFIVFNACGDAGKNRFQMKTKKNIWKYKFFYLSPPFFLLLYILAGLYLFHLISFLSPLNTALVFIFLSL